MELLGLKLLKARRKAGLSQESLGLTADVSGTTIGKIETNRTTANIITIFKLARTLGLSIDYLTGLNEFQWYNIEDRLPNKTGMYRVKKLVGSIHPKLIENDRAFFKINRGFITEDWTIITHWREDEIPG